MRNREADELFKKATVKTEAEVGTHFSYRDGFRLGFGIFVGLLVGSTLLLVLVWGLAKIFH